MTADHPAAATSVADRRDGASETTDRPGSATSPTGQPDAVEGTVLRFASAEVQIDVPITPDNPTVRDLLSLLPITIAIEEFNGREKIGYPPRRLVTQGSPGHDSEDGDLIYFAPWGNLGFYYNAEGIGHDDRVIHLGTFSAPREQLAGLEAGDVTITVAR
jgi:hypothetical protein